MRSAFASTKLKTQIWPDFIAHFKSETTKASYQSDVDEIMDYIEKDFLDIEEEDADRYFRWMKDKIKKGGLHSSTLSKKCRELHSLAEFICENREKYEMSVNFQDTYAKYLPYVSKQEKQAKSVPVKDIDRLLHVTRNDIMAYCMIVFMYRAGLSSTELCNLKTDDFVIYENGMFATVKGRREMCYIPKDLETVLDQYLKDRERKLIKMEKNCTFLFFNKRGNPLNTMYISRLLKKYTDRAGVPNYSAQSIRNTCAFTMASYGATGAQTAKQLGITTTQIARYNGMAYRDNYGQKSANDLVHIHVLPPDETK